MATRSRKIAPLSAGLLSVVALICAILLSCSFGGSGLSLFTAWQDDLSRHIFLNIRLPRIVVAGICGVALSCAGVLSQGLFRNPLASPSIMGTTAGASCAASFAFFFGVNQWHWLSLPASAFTGAIFATFLIYGLTASKRFFMIENLLLAGFALNAFLVAISSLIVSFTLEDHEKFPAAMYWLMGGLSAKSWDHVAIGVVPLVAGGWLAYRLTSKLDALSLGEDVAESLGVPVATFKRQCILLIALLVGVSVSIAGAISFVGLIVPHITRSLFGPNHRRLFLFSGVNGATLMIVSDLLARTLRSPQEIQVGLIVALLGAPFFFWLLMQKRRSSWEAQV